MITYVVNWNNLSHKPSIDNFNGLASLSLVWPAGLFIKHLYSPSSSYAIKDMMRHTKKLEATETMLKTMASNILTNCRRFTHVHIYIMNTNNFSHFSHFIVIFCGFI